MASKGKSLCGMILFFCPQIWKPMQKDFEIINWNILTIVGVCIHSCQVSWLPEILHAMVDLQHSSDHNGNTHLLLWHQEKKMISKGMQNKTQLWTLITNQNVGVIGAFTAKLYVSGTLFLQDCFPSWQRNSSRTWAFPSSNGKKYNNNMTSSWRGMCCDVIHLWFVMPLCVDPASVMLAMGQNGGWRLFMYLCPDRCYIGIGTHLCRNLCFNDHFGALTASNKVQF